MIDNITNYRFRLITIHFRFLTILFLSNTLVTVQLRQSFAGKVSTSISVQFTLQSTSLMLIFNALILNHLFLIHLLKIFFLVVRFRLWTPLLTDGYNVSRSRKSHSTLAAYFPSWSGRSGLVLIANATDIIPNKLIMYRRVEGGDWQLFALSFLNFWLIHFGRSEGMREWGKSSRWTLAS